MGKKKFETEENNFQYLPLLTLDNYVMTPQIPQPLKIDKEDQIQLLDKCYSINSDIFCATVDFSEKSSKEEKIMPYGIVCRIDKLLQMPGAPTLAFLRPLYRAYFHNSVFAQDFARAKITPLKNVQASKRFSLETKLSIERINELFKQLMQYIPEPEKTSAEKIVEENSSNLLNRIYAISHVTPTLWTEKYKVLVCNNFKELCATLLTVLDEAEQKIEIQARLHEKTHHELSQQQKEAFLRAHLKQIKTELGEDESDDISILTGRAKEKIWSKETKEHFEKEISKLRRLNINNPEYSVQYDYLDRFLSLPWEKYKNTTISLKKVESILNRDHYGMEKVKERILEQMAVLSLRKDLKAPIICLYGPPGVGKTSIGKSIAESLDREYARISLGGLHDEAEIRGHRRTYIGAMPGRFLQSLSKLKTGNPLILLDEIDKVGKDYKGDPSSALLEALDPEQNKTFHDNFIDHDYDLSNVLFIATANDLSTIPAPLRDRMEIIEMTGYIPEEKREIAQRHLVSKVLRQNGLKPEEIIFTPEALDFIIENYTREAGVRQLEKKLGKIVRKIARLKVAKENHPTTITPETAEEFLGKKETRTGKYESNDFAGVATGLAWTPVGGNILFIETSLSPGKGEKLTITGNLGDVMKESAILALQWLKANGEKLGINPAIFKNYDIHIHVPEGAVPKDGPSAGITIATSLASALLGNKINERLAMTGELTLRGKVMPVGGIKEKILAAKQGGIKKIILSEENRKDIEEIPSKYIEGLEFIYVNTLWEVLDKALSKDKATYLFDIKIPSDT